MKILVSISNEREENIIPRNLFGKIKTMVTINRNRETDGTALWHLTHQIGYL